MTKIMVDSGGSKSRLLLCWQGMGLPNWIRLLAQRPSLDISGLPRVAWITAMAALNSCLNGVESLCYRRRIARTSVHEAPLFILGHWRSGTTFLHQLLTLDPQFAFINLYEALFPGHFLLSEKWMKILTARLLPATRPMDNMPCSWDLPEEDELPLMLLTLCSPYLSAAFPLEREKFARFENLRSGLSERELTGWKEGLLYLLRKLSYKYPGRRVVLKSPMHTCRIPVLLQMFPQARFVHLVRNPFEVFASTVRLRRVMAEMNGFSRRPPKNLEEEVLDGYLKMYHAYHLQKALIKPSHLIELRYEDLVQDPVASVERVYRGLEIAGFEELRPKIEARLAGHRDYRTSTVGLSPADQSRVFDRWAPAFRRYGYSAPKFDLNT